jgi:hypothetical protein
MRLTLGIFAAVAVLSLLALGLVLLLLALLRALVTGQRPAAVTAFSRFRQFSGQQMAGRWRSGATGATESANETQGPVGARMRSPIDRANAATSDVMDVEVREITSDRPER